MYKKDVEHLRCVQEDIWHFMALKLMIVLIFFPFRCNGHVYEFGMLDSFIGFYKIAVADLGEGLDITLNVNKMDGNDLVTQYIVNTSQRRLRWHGTSYKIT